MAFQAIIWDPDDDPDGNVQHIQDHGLSKDDVEWVLMSPVSEGTSRSSGWGYTPAGDYIIVVYEQVDPDTIRVITAYDVPE